MLIAILESTSCHQPFDIATISPSIIIIAQHYLAIPPPCDLAFHRRRHLLLDFDVDVDASGAGPASSSAPPIACATWGDCGSRATSNSLRVPFANDDAVAFFEMIIGSALSLVSRGWSTSWRTCPTSVPAPELRPRSTSLGDLDTTVTCNSARLLSAFFF